MTYLFYGENAQERDEAVKGLLQSFIAVNGDMAVDVIDTEDIDTSAIIDAVTTIPFLSPKRLVVLRYLSANKEVSANIEKVLTRVADTTDLLFIESNLDARGVYAKTLKKQVADIKRFESVEGPLLQDWVVHEAERLGGKIRASDAQLLIDRVGHNQLLLHNELQKLLLIGEPITQKIITDMTHIAPKSSVFAMLDAAMQGKVSEASKLYYEQRVQGVEPQAILGMIAWQLHILAILVNSGDKSVDDIAKRAKLNPFVVRKNIPIARKISKRQMVSLVDVALQADLRIKTGKAKPSPSVHVLLLRLAEIVQTAH